MKVKKNILYVLVLITILSLCLILTCGDNRCIFNICTNILSGNIVAIVITIIEFFNERSEILDDFIEESFYLKKQVEKELDMIKFADIYKTVKETNEKEKSRKVVEITRDETNIQIIEDVMENVIGFADELNVNILGKIFSKYSGLFEVNKRNLLGRELYEVYSEFKNIQDSVQDKSIHFREYFNGINGNREVMILFLFELFETLCGTSEEGSFFLIYGDWSYNMELSIGKIMKRLNSEYEDSPYELFQRLSIYKKWNKNNHKDLYFK